VDHGRIFDRVPMLRALGEESREKLRGAVTLRVLGRGDRVWGQGAACGDFTFVLRGCVKLCKSTSGGRTPLLTIVGPGEVLCPSVVCAAPSYCCTALAMVDETAVACLERRRLLQVLEQQPSAVGAVVEAIGQQGLAGCRRIEELSSGRVEQRLAALLLRLSSQFGVDRDDGTWVPIPLSRKDMANLCGTTVETAIRTARRFEARALVRSAPQGFIVRDRPGLARISAGTERSPRRRPST